MAVDFEDPTTWDQGLDDETAISLGIWAINTILYPDASSDAQFAVLDFFGEGVTEHLARLRERLGAAVYAELEQFTATASDDEVKRDLELIHETCGENVCDIEDGDSLGLLARTAIGHVADGCAGEEQP